MSFEILVLGGGPAGLSAALNAHARGRSALVVSNPPEENPLWKAGRVDNYPGLPGVSGRALLSAMRRQAEEAGVEFVTGRVLSALPMMGSWFISVGQEMYNARAVVLATGVARGKKFPGEAEFLGRGVSYCATCDGMLYRDRPVAVVAFPTPPGGRRTSCGASAAPSPTLTGRSAVSFRAARRWSPSPATGRAPPWTQYSCCGPPWRPRTCSRGWRWKTAM